LDQQKIGKFLKQLRNEKQMTQEMLAQVFNVSSRTISRWETGCNLPDISLLVEIADFFDVDVREIIEGERKSDMMNEELHDVAEKMADYADAEKTNLLNWVRGFSLTGTFLLTLAIALQCINYEPNFMRALAILFSFLGFVGMAITTLYTNGILQKLAKKKHFGLVVKVIVGVLAIFSLRFILVFLFIYVLCFYEMSQPYVHKTGIENYDKEYILEEYGGDINSSLLIFPDDVSDMLSSDYEYFLKTGLFDTDGDIILEATYTDENYDKEVERLSEIRCTIYDTIKEDSDYHINEILYDEESYNYPAYIASDGHSSVYEYALLDDDDNKIVYVYLSYPDSLINGGHLVKYKDYLLKDLSSYVFEGNSLERFSIYYYNFGDDIWTGYDPEEEGRVTTGQER